MTSQTKWRLLCDLVPKVFGERWLVLVINSFDNTKLPCYTVDPAWSFFKNLPPLFIGNEVGCCNLENFSQENGDQNLFFTNDLLYSACYNWNKGLFDAVYHQDETAFICVLHSNISSCSYRCSKGPKYFQGILA